LYALICEKADVTLSHRKVLSYNDFKHEWKYRWSYDSQKGILLGSLIDECKDTITFLELQITFSLLKRGLMANTQWRSSLAASHG